MNPYGGWQKLFERVVQRETMFFVEAKTFVAIRVDEDDIVVIQSWLSLHAYMVKDWKRVPFLISLQRVVDGDNFGNIMSVIWGLVQFRGPCMIVPLPINWYALV